MSLKLFRSTGYSSILVPGETRVAMHPGWLVLATSAWVGFACNVALWRELRGLPGSGNLTHCLLAGLFIAAACCTLLSALGWRRTLKPASTLLLLLAALAACGLWVQSLPMDASVLDRGLGALVIPSWASLLRWQVPALLVVLALLPMIWVWHTPLRRLPGPQQFAANALGTGLGLAVLAAVGWLLSR
ncbi:MAG: phosphoethanolamine transferase domain-containing protein [Ramlibacter sp.]